MKNGDDVVFVKKAAWDSLVLSLKKFTPDFMEERIQPPPSAAQRVVVRTPCGAGKSR